MIWFFFIWKKHAFRYLTLSHVCMKKTFRFKSISKTSKIRLKKKEIYTIMLFVRIRVSDGWQKRKACGFYSRSISELATHVWLRFLHVQNEARVLVVGFGVDYNFGIFGYYSLQWSFVLVEVELPTCFLSQGWFILPPRFGLVLM